MTRVLVDLLFFTGTRGGMESYVRELYSCMDDSEFEFVGFASRELAVLGAEWFPGRLIDSGISGESRSAWARGELMSVSRVAQRIGADLVHAPANIGPIRSRVPVVITVHDLLPFRHPEWVPGAYSGILRGLIRAAVRAARRVLTVSVASRADIVELLGIPAERVDVVPLAGRSETADAGQTTGPVRHRDRILAVGNRMPHKGFDTLLEALAAIPTGVRPLLTVTGSSAEDPLIAAVERLGLGSNVSLRGWLSDAELDELYRSSAISLLPTRFEGFGLPLLEAMSRGCPVIASDIPVLREVGGHAAVYVQPGDSVALSTAILELLSDDAGRSRMSQDGLTRSREFSWRRAAEQTAAVFHRVVNDR